MATDIRYEQPFDLDVTKCISCDLEFAIDWSRHVVHCPRCHVTIAVPDEMLEELKRRRADEWTQYCAQMDEQERQREEQERQREESKSQLQRQAEQQRLKELKDYYAAKQVYRAQARKEQDRAFLVSVVLLILVIIGLAWGIMR